MKNMVFGKCNKAASWFTLKTLPGYEWLRQLPAFDIPFARI